jgi:hypothetical protein
MSNDLTRVAILNARKTDDAMASTIGFLLEGLLDTSTNGHQIKLIRSLFIPIARVTLVPRDRPMLAGSVDVDDFLARRHEVFGRLGVWAECFRTNEADERGGMRVHTNVRISDASSRGGRTIDFMIATRMSTRGRVIVRTMTVVYDEEHNSVSPITIFF